jgi:hypothetical protein
MNIRHSIVFRLILPIFLSLFLTSCSKDEAYREQIVGTWRTENEKAVIKFSFGSDGTLSTSVQEKGLMGILGGARNMFFGDYNGTWSVNDETLTINIQGVTDPAANSFFKVVFTISDAIDGKSPFDKPISCRITKLKGGVLVLSNGTVMNKIQG